MAIIKTEKTTEYEEYELLLLRRDNLRKEAEQFHLNYLRVFGDLMTEVFQQKVECIRRKKIIAYCQKLANRGADINRADLDAYIEQVMAEYRTELEQMIHTVSAIKNSGKISSYDKKKVKEIYYRLVRLIHPDIRPELAQDEVIRDYWQRIVVAYRHNDLEELEELDVLVRTYLKQHNIEAGEISLSNIKERITAIEKEIQTIISTDPYQYRFILEDKNAVNDRKQELKDELKSFREYGEQLDEVISSFNIREFYA